VIRLPRFLCVLSLCAVVPAQSVLAEGWTPAEDPAVRIFVERATDEGLESLVIFENGVTLWRGETQLRVSDAEIDRIIDAFDEAGFDEMPPFFGSGKKWLERRVSFRGGGRLKEAVQLVSGEHSAALTSLADRIFSIVEPAERTGVRAADLGEGVKKLASGELAPEAMSLLVHFKPGTGPSSGEGFLLRVDEGAVTTRSYAKERYEAAVRFEPGPEGARQVAQLLSKADVASLPGNLFALEYTEVILKVLKWKKSVQARPFAGMSATTHGEAQKRFDSLFQDLKALHREALGKGRRLSEESPAQP
jgi:hypothetical protein